MLLDSEFTNEIESNARLDHYLKENNLSQYEGLKDCFTPEILQVLFEDASLRPIFLQLLPDEALGQFDYVDTELIESLGIEDFLSQKSVFLPGSPEVANRLALAGKKEGRSAITVGVTDRYSTDIMGSDFFPVASQRQVYFPLPDGTWLGVKGSGLLSNEIKMPFSGDRGIVKSEEAEKGKAGYLTFKDADAKFVQFLAKRSLKMLPDGDGNLVPVQEEEDSEKSPVLVFNRHLTPHRFVKFPQILKADPGLHNLSKRVSQAYIHMGEIAPGTTLSGAQLIDTTLVEMGKVEAECRNKRKCAGLIHFQDVTVGGWQTDLEELVTPDYFVSLTDSEDRRYSLWRMIATRNLFTKISILGEMEETISKLHQDDLIPSPFDALSTMLDSYLDSLDTDVLTTVALGEPDFDNYKVTISDSILQRFGFQNPDELVNQIHIWAKDKLAQRNEANEIS